MKDQRPVSSAPNPVAILAIATALMGIGAVMTFSAAAVNTDRAIIGWEFWDYPAVRQLVFVAGGLVGMLVTASIPYRVWYARYGLMAKVALGVALCLLVVVLIPGLGVAVKGARRWLQIGPAALGLRFQASEPMKIALPIFLAAWMTVCADIRKFIRGFLPAVATLVICAGLVGKEDFGTAALLMLVGVAMLVFGGVRWLHLGMLVAPVIPLFGVLLIIRSNRMDRLTTFLNIWQDPEGSGYQAIQSLCTIASGGWWGRGLGRGFVKGFLPEARNDFIFAVICEELGMLGALTIIALLLALLWQSRKIIVNCPDPAGRLLAFGIAFTIGCQATMNIAVVTVSVPTKGISLPLVSAGGSGAIFLGMLVGTLASVAAGTARQLEREGQKVRKWEGENV